ncbi:MAG: glycosyltransferase, partial [Deltaproteobacteria bacterium]|nr:glycosyltransferase [Deltaproteobacteria bacterium]
TERSAFAKRAQARVLRDHTYKKRAEEIVNMLS